MEAGPGHGGAGCYTVGMPRLDLNTAPEAELDRLSVLDAASLQTALDLRPFKSWDDVERKLGLSGERLARLRAATRIGETDVDVTEAPEEEGRARP